MNFRYKKSHMMTFRHMMIFHHMITFHHMMEFNNFYKTVYDGLPSYCDALIPHKLYDSYKLYYCRLNSLVPFPTGESPI